MKKVKGMPITAAKTEMRPSRTSTNDNYSQQGAAFVDQPPEPFRDPAEPAMQPASANRAGSTPDQKIPIPRSAPSNNPGAVGIRNGVGMGASRGIVVGQGAKAKRAGGFVNVPQKKKTPSFYGR